MEWDRTAPALIRIRGSKQATTVRPVIGASVGANLHTLPLGDF